MLDVETSFHFVLFIYPVSFTVTFNFEFIKLIVPFSFYSVLSGYLHRASIQSVSLIPLDAACVPFPNPLPTPLSSWQAVPHQVQTSCEIRSSSAEKVFLPLGTSSLN